MFELRPPRSGMEGIIIGAPHGGSAPKAVQLARDLSEETGAGFAAAYGFKSKRLRVEQPVVRSGLYPQAAGDHTRGSVFRDFKKMLRQISPDRIKLYVGLRKRSANEADRIQVVSSGFTLAELKLIKRLYIENRDRIIAGRKIDKFSIAVEPLDHISWDSSGIKHHGVLMIAERGLGLRLPEKLSSVTNVQVYRDILSTWIKDVVRITRGYHSDTAPMEVKLLELGRLELIAGTKNFPGIVIGSPHGSYDEYTAEMVMQLSHQTGIAAVIATGFTPTEAGGWRINVNRPTEKTYLAPEFESATERARAVYGAFENSVLAAARGDLALYIDIHQYGRANNIQVATVGVSLAQARKLKAAYGAIRGRLLAKLSDPSIDTVEMAIEPLDAVEAGAWPAKANGILNVAKKSLHFELPLFSLFRDEKNREAYAQILAELIKRSATVLLH